MPTVAPAFVGFETSVQLRTAVAIYLQSPDDEASPVAVLDGFPVGKWDVSLITDMSSMFAGGASTFNGDISSWDTSRVTNMSNMLQGASTFNGNISSWVTSRVTDMQSMFYEASTFNGDME